MRERVAPNRALTSKQSAEHPGRLVTRDELLRAVWPGTAVSGSIVRISVGEVRAALDDDPQALPRTADLADLLAAAVRVTEARALVRTLCDGFVPDGQGPELDRVRALATALR